MQYRIQRIALVWPKRTRRFSPQGEMFGLTLLTAYGKHIHISSPKATPNTSNG